jgi:hypothetical protein
MVVDREHGHHRRIVCRVHEASVAATGRRAQWSVHANDVGGTPHRG